MYISNVCLPHELNIKIMSYLPIYDEHRDKLMLPFQIYLNEINDLKK